MKVEITKDDIVFVEYNGVGRPFQVYTKDLTGYDFFYKDGCIQCEWCSGNIRPFLNELTDEWKAKKNWKFGLMKNLDLLIILLKKKKY